MGRLGVKRITPGSVQMTGIDGLGEVQWRGPLPGDLIGTSDVMQER